MAFSGAKLRAVRNDRGMTQGQVGREMGVRPMYVSRWEGGRSGPNAQNMIKLLDTLKCELADLMEDQ